MVEEVGADYVTIAANEFTIIRKNGNQETTKSPFSTSRTSGFETKDATKQGFAKIHWKTKKTQS